MQRDTERFLVVWTEREKGHLKFQDNTLEISESCKYLVELILKAMARHRSQKYWETSI